MSNSKVKCRYCKEYTERDTAVKVPLGYFCSIDHATAHGREKSSKEREKIERKELKKRKEALKTKSDYAREAQTAFNRYIRIRDKGKPCISCDKPDNGRHQRHASHYRSVGACRALRFNLLNVWASCSVCNNHFSGNQIEYRIRLVKKIGLERVESLESQNNPRRYTIEYLKRIKKIFNKRANWYSKRR